MHISIVAFFDKLHLLFQELEVKEAAEEKM